MNARLALAALALIAASPLAAQSATVQFTCEGYVRPGMDRMRTEFGIQNFDQAYDARTRLHLTVQRACARGPRSVEIVFDRRDAEQPFRAIAAR